MNHKLLVSNHKVFPKFVSIVLLITLVSLVENTDYCAIETCADPRQHTMCLYSKESFGPGCEFIQKLTKQSKESLINAHNQLREKWATGLGTAYPKAANMMYMEWDEELAEIALRWAQQCDNSEDLCRDIDRFEIGQLVGSVQYKEGSPPASSLDIFGAWTVGGEMKKELIHDWTPEKGDDEYESLTTLIWAKTHKFGCADVAYNLNNVTVERCLVCNYGPRGNTEHQTVYKIGDPCTMCREGSSCRPQSQFEHLCYMDPPLSNRSSGSSLWLSSIEVHLFECLAIQLVMG